MDARGFDARGLDDRGFDDNVVASPASSATGSVASHSASSEAELLPDTGGSPLVPLLSAAVLVVLIGSCIAASVLMRRPS